MLNRRRHGVRVLGYYIAELGVVVACFFAAYALRSWIRTPWDLPIERLQAYLWLLPVTVVVWSVFLWVFSTYDGFRSRSLLMHAFTAAATSATGVVALFAVLTVLKQYQVNRSFVGFIGVSTFGGLLITRCAAAAFLAHYTQKGYDRHYVVIGGIHDEAVRLAGYLEGIRGGIFQVRGFVAEEGAQAGTEVGSWKVLGGFPDLPAIAAQVPVDEVFLLPTRGALEDQLALIQQCESMGISVHLRLSPFQKTISRIELVEAVGSDYLRFTTVPKSGAALLAKRVLDALLAALLLAAVSPVLLLTGILVRMTSRGGAIFRQERVGMNGRVFTLYKFRTMVEGAEKDRGKLEAQNELDGPAFKIEADPRVTGLGKLLRRTSIDELPQLWNVVKGDMSLVGPRPLPTYEVEKFEPWQRRRMSMRPGITCLWQVSGRSRVTSFTDWMRLDLEYVDRWSLGLDLKILLRTIPAVLGARGAY